MGEAEDRTLRYYCIPPHRWERLQYDLLTCQDGDWEPLPESALARVQRLWHVRPARSHVDFFRIQLNDPGILNVVHRENLHADLYPFLLYILTHEMVHLVRLSTILPEEPPSREDEENRVQGVAFRILADAPHQRLRPILARFYGD